MQNKVMVFAQKALLWGVAALYYSFLLYLQP